MSQKNYVSNSEESTRLFQSSFMEALSKVHFTVPLFIYIPANTFLFYIGIKIVEYVLHRFVFHYHPSSEFGKKIHFIFHGIHHDYPRDRLRLVMPPSVSIPLATLFFLLFRTFIPAPQLYIFFGAFLTGYLIYDMFHYAIHHVEVKGKLWNVLKTHHLKHHYNDPNKGFGVSSPIWDVIVGSNFDEKN